MIAVSVLTVGFGWLRGWMWIFVPRQETFSHAWKDHFYPINIRNLNWGGKLMIGN
jgi:hypothetical protein